MKRVHVKVCTAVLALAVIWAVSPATAQTSVDVELLLLADVSGSISSAEFNLQREGYASAFESGAVQGQIAANPLGQIAVALGYWSGASQQSLVMPWTLISSVAEANTFASDIRLTTQLYKGLTAPQSALAWGVDSSGAGLFDNLYTGTKTLIDISGDGAANDGLSGAVGRDAAITAGVTTINGLVIGGQQSVYDYYHDYVIGGTSPLLLTASSFDDFAGAIETKIYAEIGGEIPEPGFFIPLIGGLGALLWHRRRSRTQAG